MDQIDRPLSAIEAKAEFLRALRRATSTIAEAAATNDADGTFALSECAQLRRIGAFSAPVPRALGGLGLGTEPAGAAPLLETLRCIGAASLPLGRLFEGHVNALRFICRLGTPRQTARAADDAAAGHLFAVWNTDPPGDPLKLERGTLHGAKILASGAGHATRALVTANEPRQLLLVTLPLADRADLARWTAQGMRATATGKISLTGLAAPDIELIGPPDAYLGEPDFSAGAWRASAVALGGLDAILFHLRDELHRRGRDTDPHQRARLGTALIAQETAALWLAKAARLAEAETRDAGDVAAYIGLARIAVETACLDAMRLAQRSIGLAAFMRPAPLERICRDLATYLRQPAPDETLTDAAAHYTLRELPA